MDFCDATVGAAETIAAAISFEMMPASRRPFAIVNLSLLTVCLLLPVTLRAVPRPIAGCHHCLSAANRPFPFMALRAWTLVRRLPVVFLSAWRNFELREGADYTGLGLAVLAAPCIKRQSELLPITVIILIDRIAGYL